MKLFTSWRRKRLARRLVADYGRGYIEAPRLSQPPPSAPPQPGRFGSAAAFTAGLALLFAAFAAVLMDAPRMVPGMLA